MDFYKLQEKYGGKYVATECFNSLEVIAFGDGFKEVIEKARDKCADPVVFYVPKKGEKSIFYKAA